MSNITKMVPLQLDPHGIGHESALSKLHGYSITGHSHEMREKMLQDTFVLQDIAILGQWTTLYAAPNTGKTLLTLWLLKEALLNDLVDGHLVFYVNADDNYRGIVEKTELAERWGFHMIAPNQNEFRSAEIVRLMTDLAQADEAKGVVIILDTLKKFTDLMQKRDASEFGIIARGFVAAGGTLICLAHTNKHKSADGRSIYSGTSDIRDDSDCVFIMDRPDGTLTTEEVAVEFANDKARGDVTSKLSFTYKKVSGQTYSELMDTVRRIGQEQMSQIKEAATVRQSLEDDHETIMAITSAIRSGITAKSSIVRHVNETAGISHRQVRKVLNDRTGNIYTLGHRWTCMTGAHNKQHYQLISAESSSA